MKLASTLVDLAGALDELGVGFAVVGGLGASARGEVRFTRDIDLAVAVVDDAQAEQVIYRLQKSGYTVLATVEQRVVGRLATARLRSPQGVTCDLIFATCGIELEIVSGAERIEVFSGAPLPTASAEALVAMKILSAAPHRPRDAEDVRAIVRETSAFDEALLERYLGLIETRGFARGQALIEKWTKLRAELGI